MGDTRGVTGAADPEVSFYFGCSYLLGHELRSSLLTHSVLPRLNQ